MIHLDCLEKFTSEFGALCYEPLTVTIKLRSGGRVVNYDPIHLDGLLARAVVEIATEGRLVPDSEDGYWIPLPLKMLWQSEGGFPLWASSVLYPIGPRDEDVYIRHKRNSEGWMHSKQKVQTATGPWMERRIPTPIEVCDTYEARCIGNATAVRELLDHFTHIGKLRLGVVDSISVQPAGYDDWDVICDGQRLIKPIPQTSGILKMQPGAPSPIGWTPPHWKPSLFLPGWRAMVQLSTTDWFAAASDLPHPQTVL